MKPILWRLTAASAGLMVALSMNVGPASASSSEHRPEPKPVQVADQVARTEQNADSNATSEQFLPINANVPVQILSLGHNGGDTKQSNNSTAKSAAVNQAGTDQSIHQSQKTVKPQAPKHEPKGHGPKDHDGWKDHGPKGHGPKDDHEWNPEGPKGHGPKDDHDWKPEPGPIQQASQEAKTDQDAQSSATSKQILPVNVNAPVQILSLGSNGGDTKQSNNSTAESAAVNEAQTDQSAQQYQQAGPATASQQPATSAQPASQEAKTDQDAQSSATSKQILPVNVNVPVQILSLGSNGGDTAQSNNSTAESAAVNQAGTSQVIGQAQGALGGLLH